MSADLRSLWPRKGRLHLGTHRLGTSLTCGCERVFQVEILVSIDIDASPGAIEELTDDGLQRFNCPRCDQAFEIAEPLLVHHREGRRLALFVPAHVAHRALVFHAELAAEIAGADPATLPEYGLLPALLVGSRHLRAWLFGPAARSRAPRPAGEASAASDPELAAPAVRDRQGSPEIHEAFADLERADDGSPSVPPSAPEIDDVDEDEPMFSDDWLGRDTLGPAARPTPEPAAGPDAGTPPAAVEPEPEAVVDFVELLEEEEDEDEDEDESEDIAEELVADDDSEPSDAEILTVDDDEPGDIIVDPPLAAPVLSRLGTRDAPGPILEGAVRGFELDEAGRIVFAHCLPAAQVPLFDPSTADLWFQLIEVDGAPLLAVTLVSDPTMDRPHWLAWPLDPLRAADREIAHALRRSYRAEIALIDEHRNETARFELSADRELNVSVVIERAGRVLADVPPGDPSAAVEALASRPQPFGEPLPPLFKSYGLPPMEDFGQTRAVIEQLTAWLEPERYDHLVLVRSFPLDYLEEIIVEVIDRCVRLGIRLPDRLKDRAIALGQAADRGSLIRVLVENFDQLVADGKGPPEEQAAHNWRVLLTDSAEEDVAWDPRIQDRVEELLEVHGLLDEATLREAQAALAEPDGLETDQLLRMLRHRRLRPGAISALCGRAEPAAWKEAVRAAERLDTSAILGVVRDLAGLREAVAGEITGLLSSERPHVRQAAALLLGSLALRRTLMPILKALGGERTPIWPEFARAVAATGSAAVRSLERQLSDDEFPLERLALAVRLLERESPRASARFQAMAESGDERAVRLMELARSAAIEPARVAPAERFGALLRRAAAGETIPEEEAAPVVEAYRASLEP